jgi:hypothetical protein
MGSDDDGYDGTEIGGGNIKIHKGDINKESFTDSETAIEVVPEDYRLAQNHPNPFNPLTTIEFDLPNASHVRIEVYNTTGQKVSTLLNKNMPAGGHRVEFDAQNFPSGIYLYRIEAGQFQAVKKMILLK